MEAALTAGREVSVGEALGLGRAAHARVQEHDAPDAWLVCVECRGDELVHGRWQRPAPGALSRATGGPTWRLGHGTLYVALALRDASTLIDTPPDRILNRNVRGILQGLRGLGAPVVYGGREILSSTGRVVGLVGWTRSPDRGAVLIEAALAISRPVDGEPSHDATRFAGMPIATLAEVWGSAPPTDELVQRITRGYEALGDRRFVATDLDPIEHAEAPTADGLTWSRVARVPIGSLCVGARIDGAMIEHVAVRGDLFQEEDADARLLAALRASPDPRRELDAIVARVYGRGGAVLEGLRDLAPLAACLREALSS